MLYFCFFIDNSYNLLYFLYFILLLLQTIIDILLETSLTFYDVYPNI